MVTVDIYLYRLPFRYKVYYDKINKNFENYIKQDENKNINIFQNLWNYYSNVLTAEEKNNHVIKLHFNFDLERETKMMDITKILRGIKPLELEPENITEVYNNEKMIEIKINHFTDFITYSKEKKRIIFPQSSIDKYVNIEDKIILNVYEVLNSNGMKKIFEEEKRDNIYNLYTFTFKKNIHISNLESFHQIIKDTHFYSNITNYSERISSNENNIENKTIETSILSLKEEMILFPNENIYSQTCSSRKIIAEFALPIFHYLRSKEKSKFLFRDFYHERIEDFPVQYIILNNTYNLSIKHIYEYIWNLNILYMNHPNIDTSNFWWNNIDELSTKDESLEKNNKIKICYPFVLRYLDMTEKKEKHKINLIHCPICPWYSFCPGCIIDPRSDIKDLYSQIGIVVDWCHSFVEEEFQKSNFQLCKEIDNQIISENLPIIDKEEKYQSIKDCFDLFFEEENLEDPLYCHKCQGPEDFSKRYSINRLPYVLILSLKRFKFNQNSNFKLRQMITYPLYDLELVDGNNKKIYDLYGVVNHYGNLRSGHYTAIVKKNKEWYLCNDSKVNKIEENKVMNANAYILFYICKESPYQNDYFRFMKSIMNNIIIDKNKKEAFLKKDLNFFRGEPVITEYGEGYVVKDNIVDFNFNENYDIYDELKKTEDLRVEKLNKKHKKEKQNEKEDNKDISDKKENEEKKISNE